MSRSTAIGPATAACGLALAGLRTSAKPQAAARSLTMRTSVRALLSQIIDYAGLFPPAKLPLDAALTGYLRDRKESPQRWMLGRFVCPASVLAELMALAKGNADRALL